jgi:signal transduction histidine kinase
MRDYLKRLLSQYYTVEAVANGAAALAIARQRLPDLVLSDVMMPGLDGFELLHALRTDPRTHSVPVILLSARAGEEASIEGLQAGANDYLTKPFSTRELLARVRARLEIARMQEEAVHQEREHAMHLQKLADENAQLYHQAQEAVRDRDNLLSMVSHDLKNPLTAIKGNTQLVRRSINRANLPEKEDVIAGLIRIEALVTRMTALLNELLDLAHVHIGHSIELKRNPLDLVKLTRQVVEEQQQATERHSIRLETELTELVGQFDPVRIERVLTNLISNAIKYDPEGHPITVRISRAVHEGSSYAILEVQDQGIGIPAADLPHIFEQFHRASNVLGNMRGTGIGLASVHQVVKLHGGTIHVISQEGVGSTFTVRLPLL